MSDLTNIEKRKLEKLLRMGGGYVLDVFIWQDLKIYVKFYQATFST